MKDVEKTTLKIKKTLKINKKWCKIVLFYAGDIKKVQQIKMLHFLYLI